VPINTQSLLKIVSRCRRTLQNEGHSATGAQVGLSSCRPQVQSPFVQSPTLYC